MASLRNTTCKLLIRLQAEIKMSEKIPDLRKLCGVIMVNIDFVLKLMAFFPWQIFRFYLSWNRDFNANSTLFANKVMGTKDKNNLGRKLSYYGSSKKLGHFKQDSNMLMLRRVLYFSPRLFEKSSSFALGLNFVKRTFCS